MQGLWEKVNFLLRTNPEIKRIEMSNWGEIFLNKDIVKILEYAFRKGVTLYCGNGTNFNNVSEEALEALVKYRVEYLNISIDGATHIFNLSRGW